MRFSPKECTTGWIPLQVGIAMGCTISPSLFVLAMQIVLNAVGAGIPEAHMEGYTCLHGRHRNRLKQEAGRLWTSCSVTKIKRLPELWTECDCQNASSGQIQSLAFTIPFLADAALAIHHIRNRIAVGVRK